jgi:hypothetical protein
MQILQLGLGATYLLVMFNFRKECFFFQRTTGFEAVYLQFVWILMKREFSLIPEHSLINVTDLRTR